MSGAGVSDVKIFGWLVKRDSAKFDSCSLGLVISMSTELGYKAGPRLRESRLLVVRKFRQPMVHLIAQLSTRTTSCSSCFRATVNRLADDAKVVILYVIPPIIEHQYT